MKKIYIVGLVVTVLTILIGCKKENLSGQANAKDLSPKLAIDATKVIQSTYSNAYADFQWYDATHCIITTVHLAASKSEDGAVGGAVSISQFNVCTGFLFISIEGDDASSFNFTESKDQTSASLVATFPTWDSITNRFTIISVNIKWIAGGALLTNVTKTIYKYDGTTSIFIFRGSFREGTATGTVNLSVDIPPLPNYTAFPSYFAELQQSSAITH